MIIDITEKVNQLGEDTMWQDSLKTIFYELAELVGPFKCLGEHPTLIAGFGWELRVASDPCVKQTYIVEIFDEKLVVAYILKYGVLPRCASRLCSLVQ